MTTIRDPPIYVRCHIYDSLHHTHQRIPKMDAQRLHDGAEGPRSHKERLQMCQACNHCR